MKKIIIAGSTGSIGVNCLQVIERHSDKFKVIGLSCNKNIELLEKQILFFKPKYAAVPEKIQRDYLKLKFPKLIIFSGNNYLSDYAEKIEYDIAVISVVGAIGLMPAIKCLERGKRAAIANKEPLVIAGRLIREIAKKNNAEIIPIDSEHSAIFQCIKNELPADIKKIILTASGGPFFNKKIDLKKIKPESALAHPNWQMGKKITIDSATLMNKGLEVIEARWLFDMPTEKIEVIIHPQSVIHSMVEYIDGSVIAQLGAADMKIPIQYALSYPERLSNNFDKLNLLKNSMLSFYPPDMKKFRCLKLAFDAIKADGCAPAILNAANEIAVCAFLEKRIRFDHIPAAIEAALNALKNIPNPTLDEIIHADKTARIFTENYIKKFSVKKL